MKDLWALPAYVVCDSSMCSELIDSDEYCIFNVQAPVINERLFNFNEDENFNKGHFFEDSESEY